jgi:hypothetical protein
MVIKTELIDAQIIKDEDGQPSQAMRTDVPRCV